MQIPLRKLIGKLSFVKFKTIFKELKKINYPNVFTMQTAREHDGNEIFTVVQHMEILRRIYAESF